MDKIKNKYEIILGFVTLVISLSAFKDDLSKIEIALGYTTISAADYFLYCVYGFSVCLYFYILENIFRDIKVGAWKFWDYLIKIAFFFFVFIILTPLLLLLNVALAKFLTTSFETRSYLTILPVILSTIATILAAISTSVVAIKMRKLKQQEALEEKEIHELENSVKLFNDGYYSHSVLESFKVLENHLFNEISKMDIRVQRHNFGEL